MEPKVRNLYKVSAKEWVTATYVAARNQQEAVDKVNEAHVEQDPNKFSVTYVDEVYV